MYKKVRCTCEVVVLLIKPIVFFTFSLLSASLDLKVPIILTNVVEKPPRFNFLRILIDPRLLIQLSLTILKES